MSDIIVLPPPISKITNNIWIGSAHDAKKATKQDFDAILNVAYEVDYTPPADVLYFKVGMDEHGNVPCGRITSIMWWLDTCSKKQLRTLVHCACGISRSPMIVAAYLSAFDSELAGIEAAMNYVKLKRDVSFTAQTPFIENVKRCL